MLAYLANTVIFILVGIVITEQAAVVFTKKDLLDIFVLYIGANFIRSEIKENHLTIQGACNDFSVLNEFQGGGLVFFFPSPLPITKRDFIPATGAGLI